MDYEKRTKNNVLFIELNEFNYDLLNSLASQLNLTHLQKLLSFHQTETYTDDVYSSDFLEPWVQWVSVHTGQPSVQHQIKHLGDVPHLGTPQIWEELSDKGITSGIWGAMNASRGSAENCLYFLPDPWTDSEMSFPNELDPLLDILRYSTKNYLNPSKITLAKKTTRFLSFLLKKGAIPSFAKELLHMYKHSKEFPGEAFVYISLFDYLSSLLFLKMNQKYQPQFSLIFLNSLAHLQHHHWNQKGIEQCPKFKYGLKYLDKAIGNLLASMGPDDTILAANALSQKNTNEEKPWILYRQTDQSQFLTKMGLSFSKVEPHMTHDAHIFFENEAQRKEAQKVLIEASINGEPLFHVESYEQDPLKLFYKIIFTDEMKRDATLTLNNKTYPFFELFQPIIRRTGKHIQQATLLCNKDLFPKKIYNHEIYKCILQSFFSSKRFESRLENKTCLNY